ncbi:hypothetical protein OWM54_10040 [Myxococcus sp. MISCRS1]|jgi:hypothetical protein|uniref:hypothetical protein n=1 Tax=Myxococcus TaxID=32 RepID=UPI00226F15C3|nr:hypothetical protein [Myxococcus sp. MISCRS1]MCY0997476.1 hypothetical protein [Myxococcus sp. MISCRS1]BDT32512.1 endonuclease Q family protein [Myxococcus sp. MH1]
MPARRVSLVPVSLCATVALALLSGCGGGLATSNPRYFTDGKWNALDSPYALTPMLACAYPAEGNDKVYRNLEDHLAPAIWSAYGKDVSEVKVKKLKGDSEWCDAFPNIAADRFIVPPRMKKELAEYVKQSGARGVIIPVAHLYRSPIMKDVLGPDGSPIGSVETDRFGADGTAGLFVHYINESGELVYTGRSKTNGLGVLANPIDYMRDHASDYAQQMTQKAPPVTLQ